MPLRPAPRDIGENRKNGNLVIVVPEKKRIAREQNQAEEDDQRSGEKRAGELASKRRAP